MAFYPSLFYEDKIIPFDILKDLKGAALPPYVLNAIKILVDWRQGKKEVTLFTSGTVGEPKLINLPRESIEESCRVTGKAFGLKEGDTFFNCLSTNHIAGVMMVLRAAVLNCNLILEAPSSDPLEYDYSNMKIDFASFVPMQLANITRYDYKVNFFNNSKAIIIGGAPVSENLEALTEKFNAPVFHTYGMTETCGHIAIRRMNGQKKETFFTTIDRLEINKNDKGCLMLRGKITKDEWLITNDAVYIISDRSFVWIGRVDEAINSGGLKLFPVEIEHKIEKLISEKVISIKSEYFISSLPDVDLGEKVILVLEDEPFETTQLLKILKEHLPQFSNPKEIHFFQKFLRTELGKLRKKEMKSLLPV